MIANENTYIDKAFKQLQVISQDEEKRWLYRSREKAIRDQLQSAHEAERRVREAERMVREATQRERVARDEEREKGISNMIKFEKDLSLSKENVPLRLIQDYKIPQAEAEEKVNHYWDN